MAMSWETVSRGIGSAGETVTVTEHWYLTEDRSRVVKEGDPDGRWLWASPGTQVPRGDAIRYGALVEEPVEEVAAVDPEPEPEKADEPAAEEKKAPQAPNKAVKKAANKAAKPEGE